eukprot:5090819-Alexandrium_andersonii.AAC.1
MACVSTAVGATGNGGTAMGSKSTARGSGVGRPRGRMTSAACGGGGAPSTVCNNSHSASPQSSA